MRLNGMLALAAVGLALCTATAGAQQTPPSKPVAKSEPAAKSEPSAWDQTKTMTRKEWDAAKKKWAMEKVKWADCNRQARAEKLSTPKSWSFVATCMTKS